MMAKTSPGSDERFIGSTSASKIRCRLRAIYLISFYTHLSPSNKQDKVREEHQIGVQDSARLAAQEVSTVVFTTAESTRNLEVTTKYNSLCEKSSRRFGACRLFLEC
jgi:hypothetical protein